VVLWTLTVLALLAAVASLLLARRLGRRLDALSQSYWELRYDYTRLRSQVARLDPGEAPEPEPAASSPSMTFVPLSSIRKKDS
jgi:hypothetical protein